MSELIQLESLPVETLAEMANEAAAACEASGRKTVEHAIRCGRALLAAKEQVKHGEWGEWLQQHFDQTQMRATQYMAIAKLNTCLNLDDATSISGALRLIAESPEKQAKKQEREAKKQERQPEKTEAPAKPLAPTAPAPPAKLDRPEWLADPDELERPEEDDLPPLPKTNTHHTAANRRTPDARETDRIGLVSPDDPRELQDGAWYVWSEERNRLLPVTDEDVLRRFDQMRRERAPKAGQVMPVIPWPPETAPVAEPASTTTPVVEPTKEIVSSKPGKVPTVTQLRSMVEQRADIGTHRHLWSEAMVKAVQEWAGYKQSLTGKAKIRSLEQWGVALSRIENVVMIQGWPAVADMIEKAIANGWQGWEHEINDRKTRGMAGGRIYSQLEKAKVKYDPLPE